MRNKVGRKAINKDIKKSEVVAVNMTNKEKLMLIQMSTKANKSLSDYLYDAMYSRYILENKLPKGKG